MSRLAVGQGHMVGLRYSYSVNDKVVANRDIEYYGRIIARKGEIGVITQRHGSASDDYYTVQFPHDSGIANPREISDFSEIG